MGAQYNRNDVTAALKKLGLVKGDVVFSHSNVGFFGIPEEGKSAEVACRVVLDAFMDVLGEEGTLIVPTFTYSFPKREVFVPDETPSPCGIFTEFLRKLPGVCRSEDPCISVAAIGGRAEEFTRNVPENSYGPDSFFDRFYRAHGTICNLNFDAGSTFVHYVERALKVPYRFDKTFKGQIEKKGILYDRKSTIWVRYVSSEHTSAVFEPFDQLATSVGMYKREKVGRGFIGAITAEDTFNLIKKTLPVRPWLLTLAERTGVIPELIPEG